MLEEREWERGDERYHQRKDDGLLPGHPRVLTGGPQGEYNRAVPQSPFQPALPISRDDAIGLVDEGNRILQGIMALFDGPDVELAGSSEAAVAQDVATFQRLCREAAEFKAVTERIHKAEAHD